MAVAVCQVLNPGFPFCAGGGCQTINNRLPCRVETAVIQDALFGQFFPVDTCHRPGSEIPFAGRAANE